MEIVYLLTYLDSQTGGMERQALQLAKRLRKNGHEIFFITCAYLGHMSKEHLRIVDKKEGFQVYRIPLVGGARYLNIVLYGLGVLALLFILRKRYDIIHAHQLYTSGVVAGFAKLFLRSKKLVVKNCCGGEFGDVKFLNILPGSLWIKKMMRRAVDEWIAISEETRKEMVVESFHPIVDIPNGVDTEHFYPSDTAQKTALRKEMGIAPDKKIALFVGKFDPQKNIPVLLEAMRNVRCNTHLWIVGDGPLRPSFERYVATHNLGDEITFCGTVRDVRIYYQVVDLFVLPSRAEGLSNVLLEAMSSGLPVIGSDIEGIRALATHKVNSYLVPLDDAPALAYAITHIITHPQEAERIGNEARSSMVKQFSIGDIVKKYDKLYQSFIF
ncbi:MAG: Glycosyl transferase group 1 [Parcubacteria group bacterium GW2011_GWC2_45_7]|nr:MAG: Glycosyl transferase group 1 [Parcubacteria group bacterium GW2011_GWC2_45_7]KKU74111.1 MAG: Glycosyl transferase group 1 [Parcubacteria group bacterium GW2011_GWA2_47_26]